MSVRAAATLVAAVLPLAAVPAATRTGGAGLDPPPAGGATGQAADPAPAGMIALPGGTYRAAERVGPLGDVLYTRVAPFLLDRTEVTVSEYAACVRAGRCTPAATTVRWEGLSGAERGRWSAACNGERADRGDHPVNCVDWHQAAAFCAFAGKRLPTEAEREWAARGGAAGTAYPWGDLAPADRACWSGPGHDGGGAPTGTCPVGSHAAGAAPSGVQDLAGNVWEWTSTADVVAADSRGRGGTPVRIARGGGWADTEPSRLTAGARAKDASVERAADLGFRCARGR
jgi:formylglycine-generating enzyme required for sulfatase activity